MITVNDKHFNPLYTPEQIQEIVDKVAEKITRDYSDKNPIFLPVLNGAFMFAADLMKRLDFPCEISFIKYSSYAGMRTTGKVKSIIGIPERVKDRHVVVVEDIVETGFTMQTLMEDLKAAGVASASVAAFLTKSSLLKAPIKVDYVGVDISPLFVVGYGLDYDGHGRNNPALYQLAAEEADENRMI